MKSSWRYLILIKRLFQPVYSEVEKLIASSNCKCFLTNCWKAIQDQQTSRNTAFVEASLSKTRREQPLIVWTLTTYLLSFS